MGPITKYMRRAKGTSYAIARATARSYIIMCAHFCFWGQVCATACMYIYTRIPERDTMFLVRATYFFSTRSFANKFCACRRRIYKSCPQACRFSCLACLRVLGSKKLLFEIQVQKSFEHRSLFIYTPHIYFSPLILSFTSRPLVLIKQPSRACPLSFHDRPHQGN